MEAAQRTQTGKSNGDAGGTKEHVGRRAKGRSASRRATSDRRSASHGLVRFVRDLPRTIGVQMRAHPPETVAAVGVVSFALGAVMGSKLGRLMLAVAIPLAVKSAFEGEISRELGKYAQGLLRDAQSPHPADA